MKTKRLILLGATGSIGTSAVDVVRTHPDEFRLVAVSALRSREACEALAREFGARAYVGEEAACRAVEENEADVCLVATVGASGLRPTLAAIEKGMDIALATKEVMVMAGELVTARARARGVRFRPVDSEHSAVFQALQGGGAVDRLVLTASGGPFLDGPADLSTVTVGQALNHPRWKMGPKVTVDSATMMNKGLEFIEAMHLFGVTPDDIRVVVHPQSIIHSMVELVDGTVIAQLGVPDMGLPIQLAMTYPDRVDSPFDRLDFYAMKDMTFEAPDYEKTPCLKLAMDCARIGGTAPCIMSAANEVAVAMFLNHRLGYNQIYDCALQAVQSIEIVQQPDLEAVLAADEQARVFVREHFS